MSVNISTDKKKLLKKVFYAVAFGRVLNEDENSSDKEEKKVTVNDRFPVAKYERPIRDALIFIILLALFFIVLSFVFAFFNNTFLSDTFFVLTLILVACSMFTLIGSIFWRKDYVLDEDGFIIPGEKYAMSIFAGREKDPFIDADNKLRRFLLQCQGMPERAYYKNFYWRCVDIGDRSIVYEVYINNVLGGYEFLKKNLNLLSVEFGDPDGAELKKVGTDKYELTFDKLGATGVDYSAGVDYWGEVES